VKTVEVSLDTKLACVEVEAVSLIDAMNMLPKMVDTIKVGLSMVGCSIVFVFLSSLAMQQFWWLAWLRLVALCCIGRFSLLRVYLAI
jgi:hypothetical protein